MKILLAIAGVLLLLVLGAGIFVRTASHDPAVWHVDPLVAANPETPNFHRVAPPGTAADATTSVSPVFRASPAELAQSVDRFAMAQPLVERVGGSPEEGFVTYVQRTPMVRYPDYISVKVVDLGDGTSALAILSRSRFGKSDLGVNKARMESWLAGIDAPRA